MKKTLAIILAAIIVFTAFPITVFAYGPAAGEEYEQGGLDIAYATVKPTITVSTQTLDKIPDDRIVSVTINVKGATKKYCNTKLHIQYSSKLSIEWQDGAPATSGEALDNLGTYSSYDNGFIVLKTSPNPYI